MMVRRVIRLAVLGAASGVCACSTRPLDSPTTVQVRADRGWQPAGVRVNANQTFTIEYVAGTIHDREVTIANGGGADYVCGSADCCEPIPNERRAALIARVEGHIFVVGNRTRFTAPQAGRVFLRINDCDDGLGDNGGTLEVRIVP
jgi:hypothetical protein